MGWLYYVSGLILGSIITSVIFLLRIKTSGKLFIAEDKADNSKYLTLKSSVSIEEMSTKRYVIFDVVNINVDTRR